MCGQGGRKTWRKCVKGDLDELGLHHELDMWIGLILGKTSNPS